jgi:calcineurin-like phosphoesterase family protein
MPKIWCTADLHFNHPKCIEYCGRPFKSLEDMHRVLIFNWNQRIKPEDIVIINGDFMFHSKQYTFDYFQKVLNGNKTFVLGNHDFKNRLPSKITSLSLYHAKQEIFVTHNPDHYNKSYKINLVAHVHQYWKIKKIGNSILYNVGVDVHDFMPVSLNEILENIQRAYKRKEII